MFVEEYEDFAVESSFHGAVDASITFPLRNIQSDTYRSIIVTESIKSI